MKNKHSNLILSLAMNLIYNFFISLPQFPLWICFILVFSMNVLILVSGSPEDFISQNQFLFGVCETGVKPLAVILAPPLV